MPTMAIETKYLHPTDHKGARIKASTCEPDLGSVTVGFHEAENPYRLAAEMLRDKLAWKG